MTSQTANPSPPPTPGGAGPRLRDERDLSRVNPEGLMAEVNRPRMGRMLAISTCFHIALIGLTSLSYLGLCVKYKTLHPKWVLKQIAKDEVEKQAAAEAAKLADEASKKAAARGAFAKKGPGGQEGAEPGSSGGEAGKKPGDKKSGIEKAITETSKERPKDSSVNLDDALR